MVGVLLFGLDRDVHADDEDDFAIRLYARTLASESAFVSIGQAHAERVLELHDEVHSPLTIVEIVQVPGQVRIFRKVGLHLCFFHAHMVLYVKRCWGIENLQFRLLGF